MADDDSWSLKEDYHFDLGAECRNIIYHSKLNVILFTTSNAEVLVFDVNTGTVLHRSCLSDKSDKKLQGTYLSDGVNKILYTDGRAIGVRSDYNGVLLLDTILQAPVFRSEDVIKLELLLSEAIILSDCLSSTVLPEAEHVKKVFHEINFGMYKAHGKILNVKFGAKAQQLRIQSWNTICLELPHTVLKLVCSGLVWELKKQKKNVPALPIASAISERLNGLLPGLAIEGENIDRELMHSEAARHETFSKWPHMNYKWALPDQMAQAGFYHEPNPTNHDRALCFICNVCLVCWEPTDEPWSEHERHSPVCPFVRGEYTHNVPMLVILATAPALVPGDPVDVLSTTNVAGFVATASHNGLVNIWNVKSQLKREISFYITPCDQEINNKESLEFIATKNLTMSFLPNMDAESDNLQLTALALVGTKQVQQSEEPEDVTKSAASSTVSNEDLSSADIRPCLVCGVTVSMNNLSQLRALENVWASSTNLAPSSSLIRAMNSVNSATSNNSLDIMKVADTYNPLCSHYLVVCDFHHKSIPAESMKDDNSDAKDSKKKDGAVSSAVTGTGTSASSNGNRQDNMFPEIMTSKFLLEDVIEDVDAQIAVGNKHYSFPPPIQYTASSSNGVHATTIDITLPQISAQFDNNYNPINGEQFASTSDIGGMNKKSPDVTKAVNSEPMVVQSLRIDAPESLRITHVAPTKDGKHLYVALCPKEPTVESNQMDVDEDSEFYTSKSYVYWDQNEAHCNGEIRNDRHSNALLLVYALDFSDKVVKVSREPLWRQELNADQAPLEHVMIPLRNGKRKDDNDDETETKEEDEERGPRGLIALVCKDGIVRLLDLQKLRMVSIARPPTDKFVSAAYCNSLERLCISTSTGVLYFYSLNGDDESVGEKETDELNMVTDSASSIDAAPSTSASSKLEEDPIIANRPKLTNSDLRTLYKLTRFERGSPPFIASVSQCWSEMMQAQRQRRHPQHLHQTEDNTRTWKLQNDSFSWDEHVFELSLPRHYTTQGTIEHVDVRFTLYPPSNEIPNIQVTLLNMSRTGPSKQMTSVDDRIDFNLSSDSKNENPSILDDYLQNHNCERLCGPISLQRCMDMSDQYGSVTLTSPKLFSTKVKTLLVHLKAITDQTKDATGKTKAHDSKPPTSKKLRIDESGPLLPGAIIERFATNAKKVETYIGCDLIYEISITIRSLSLPSVPNERQQRIAMLHSTNFIDNLLSVACLETDDKSPITQSLALDILIWVIAIRLARLRPGKDNNATKAMQYETVHCVQKKLPELLRTCFLYGGRSVAHKCVKIVLLCSEGLIDLDEPSPHTFEEAVLNVLVSLLPSIVEIQWAGSLRWMFVLITRLLPLDVNHSVAQQCIPLVQKIANEISNRVNPYHSLLATRFGLYTSPFETELFDMEPPALPKFSSVPVNYASAVTGEHNTTSATSINCVYSQESFDLRDLLNLPSHSNNELVVPSKLKTLCANYNMKGLLEVEPLHFTCHSASDGTKMEKIDMGVSATGATNIYDTVNIGPDLKSLNNETFREDVLFPWTKLLCWPSQQALVVERMHSGARRFIVLDFGSPVLLTDFMIPCCSELVSLYIDIWNKSEEIDGIRLVVAGDIGSKPLVVSDLQPPPVCRYLKITTIGRYGLNATRCKIPLGIFYGHLGILPGEDYSEMNGSQSSLSNLSESALQSTLEAQYNVLSALSEEIQCRMGLATERLKQYLDPLLCAETPNVVHMQHFLQHQKNISQNKEIASSKILTTYKECMMFQNQLNVIRGVWRRLQSWQGIRNPPNTSLADASSDKLRILCETLLDVLLYTMYEIGPVPSIPTSLYDAFTISTCEKLFHSICVVTPAPRLQLHVVALLARMAGHQAWWGKFLASTLVNLFSSFASQIFPQDRVFILLTFLGRKSLISGVNKSSVIESMVSILETLLSTLFNNDSDEDSDSGTQEGLDITLIGWVLLYLSVCLDTTFSFPAIDDSHDKNKYQSGVLSRWEFIQGESAMQRKYVNANRSANSRNYQRKLQKQLMRHKQQMHELEQAKKVLYTPALWSVTPSTHAASLSSKLEAALKTEERNMKKSLMNSAKHIKDILTFRRNDAGYYSRNLRSQSTASSSSRAETIDPIDYDVLRTLSHKNILPVAKGLINLILSNIINVDMFLLACKVVARLVVSTRPAIGLSDLMTDDQLLKLVKLATGESDSAWCSHAICCLLQDILEGGKQTSLKNFSNQESTSSEKNYPRSSTEETRSTEEDGAVAGPSKVSTSSSVVTVGGTEESFVTADDDTQDSVTINSQPNTSTSKSNGFTLPSLWESDDSEIDDFLDDILEHGKNYVKKGNIVISKLPTNANLTTSLAMDARLEYGVESGIEITLRKLATIGLFNLPFCINATNLSYPQVTPSSSTSDSPRQAASSSRHSSISSQNDETTHNSNLTSSNLTMLTRCFDRLFSGLYMQNTNTNLEQVLQLWITLNMDVSPEVNTSNMSHFDSSVTPVLSLSSAAISGLINAFYWHPGVSLRAWCLALQCLTLASNQSLVVTRVENERGASRLPHMDIILGGMASCIIKERNLGGMLLRLLSGSGLESDSSDKQHALAGPTVCTALQDFLVRLQMRCDVVTVDSGLGIALKELLLWLVYQLVQPNGAIASRRGPLDAQCKLIGSLLNLNFVNTEIGTPMSISKCVADLVYTHVRTSGVGARCSGFTTQAGGFSGLFASVLGGDARQYRPASWELLIVNLIKLVTNLVQTPLPHYSPNNADNQTKQNTSQTDESKAAEQTSSRNKKTWKPQVPCVADTVLQHEPTMMRLLSVLSLSSGSSLAMLLGDSATTGTNTELGDPHSIADATFELLTTLDYKASNIDLVLNPIRRYLASYGTQESDNFNQGIMQLSEPLLWYILRVLDNTKALSSFTSMFGMHIICSSLVRSSKTNKGRSGAIGMSSSNGPTGVIAMIMQHLCNTPNVTTAPSSSRKDAANNLEVFDDGCINFAPLGNITWLNPTAQPADVLIISATPHRRARTPAWSYHFYPDETWVDLTITLPCAVLLKEVELQPHNPSLSTCPSAVAIEISREVNSALTPVCPPMPTAGLNFIHITLSKPEVVTVVLIRLYKPRDSSDVNLSQIKLLGTTAFGDRYYDIFDEEQLTKSSLGWLRLLDQCLSVSTIDPRLCANVMSAVTCVEGLVEACINLLLLPAPFLFTQNIDRVLLHLGLHSRELGHNLITSLLKIRSNFHYQVTPANQDTSIVQMIVELLQQLCSSQDANTESRVAAVLSWLQTVSDSIYFSQTNTVLPPAIYIHCISTIIWKAHTEQSSLNYNLSALITDHLFDSLYYTVAEVKRTTLKQAFDAVLCAMCHVRPELFKKLLKNLQDDFSNVDKTANDNSEEQSSEQPVRSPPNFMHWYKEISRSSQKRLPISSNQLLTVFAAARSPSGIQQLIESELPSVLIKCILDFCESERSKHQKSESNANEVDSSSAITDSDKEGAASSKMTNFDNCMSHPGGIATILEAFIYVCSEGEMRDWLGKEGSSFWFELLSLLSNRPVESSSLSSSRYSRRNIDYSNLECTMIKFLSACCWCHPENQKLLAKHLTDVLLKQKVPPNTLYFYGISGFTRRLILQLLLENEKVAVFVTSESYKVSNWTEGNQSCRAIPAHPAYPVGDHHQFLYLSTQLTVEDILQQLSDTWLHLFFNNNCKTHEASTSGIGRTKDNWEQNMTLADTLSVAAGNTAKSKRAKEAQFHRIQSQSRTSIINSMMKRLRRNDSAMRMTGAQQAIGMTSTCNHTKSTNNQYLVHPAYPNTQLSADLTIAQLLAIAEDNGISLSKPCLYLTLRDSSKDPKDLPATPNGPVLDKSYRSVKSCLEVFSAHGGLTALARHLPRVYPESSQPSSFPAKTVPSSPEQPDAEWVKLEANEEVYEDAGDNGATNSPRMTPPTPHVPPHSLAAFGLFLRLPNYSEVLLRDRKRAQCLLRLALGVTDDGDGSDILSSPIASTLPTLPFLVLKQLLDDTPSNTDDGLLLRRTMIDIGAVNLLLDCLAIFTHQSDREVVGNSATGSTGEIKGSTNKPENKQYFWAKGTGYGTGSTQQAWNVEQSLLRQRWEEEHVTILLHVFASYIGSTGDEPRKELPSSFPDLLSRSCLLPALSSYLRNDSVMDMARHIPLYKVILQLIRAMALSSQLVPLLAPKCDGTSSEPSIVSLLSNMKLCVDNYAHKINCTRVNKTRIIKMTDGADEDEGLSMLIPDIQESTAIVQKATSRLIDTGDKNDGPSAPQPDIPLKSLEQRYLEIMKNLQFDTYEMIVENPDGGGFKFAISYHFESNMRAAGERSHPTRVKRLAQEAVTLSTALPLSYSSSVFVRCDADRLDIMKVLITGPEGTPYANGCFEFDVYFPVEYPNSPMMINLETTGRRTVRFNPNLYNDGKVCLSVLNTWHGRPEEKWNAHTSSFLQVLVSIQSLILVSEPYFNEPGYERARGTPNGAQSSQDYNANVYQLTAKWAMLDQIRNPCPCFKEVIHTHFWLKRHEIVAQIEGWIRELEAVESEGRSARNSSHSVVSLKRHYKMLREELNKLPTPEGLEDLAEPLASPGSPLETSSTTPSTPPTCTAGDTTNTSLAPPQSNVGADLASSSSNHVHHDIDTDVEMEKMVSKVCE